MTSPMPADGKNGIINYPGKIYRVRVKNISYNWEVIFTESHARSHRAFYPHQRAVARFALTLQFKGYAEYKDFINFMWGFVSGFAAHQQQYINMYVQVPSYNFGRTGVPVGGIADTDRVASALFEPTIVFEGMDDPLDPVQLSGLSDATSQPDTSQAGSIETQYFYPFSPASENASLTAEQVYDPKSTAGQGVSGILNQAAGGTVLPPQLPVPQQGIIPAGGLGVGHF